MYDVLAVVGNPCQCDCGGHRTTLRRWFFPSTSVWVLGGSTEVASLYSKLPSPLSPLPVLDTTTFFSVHVTVCVHIPVCVVHMKTTGQPWAGWSSQTPSTMSIQTRSLTSLELTKKSQDCPGVPRLCLVLHTILPTPHPRARITIAWSLQGLICTQS